MRPLFSMLLLTACLLSSCGQSPPEVLPTPAVPSGTPQPSLAPSLTPAPSTSTSPPTPASATPAAGPTFPPEFAYREGSSAPLDRPLIAIDTGLGTDKILMLADPAEEVVYRFSFQYFARFATPFLAGLSPDTRYFVYFTGGYLETIYGAEHWRATTTDLQLHVTSRLYLYRTSAK